MDMASNFSTKSKFTFYIILFLYSCFPSGEPAELNPDLFKNQLHFGYGINYKYNGQLYHNLDRVWVVHRIVLPKLQDLKKFPDFPPALMCGVMPAEKAQQKNNDMFRVYRNYTMAKLCKMTQPHLELLRKRASYHKEQVSKLIRDDLYHALHRLPPVSEFEYTRHSKRSLPPTQEPVLDIGPLTNTTLKTSDIPRNRTRRFLAAIASAAIPVIGKVATLAVEELSSYLQRRRNKAMNVALEKLDNEHKHNRNMMHHLNKDFLLYGEYDVNSTEAILEMLTRQDERTTSLAKWLNGSSLMWKNYFYANDKGVTLYSHMLQLYAESIKERYIRLYEAFEDELRLLLRSIAILSKGYLPPQIFPPSKIVEISNRAIGMIRARNPDYVLALPHITDYYDMRLVTFGLDDKERLVICFPIFIKDFNKEPMTLYQIETVKVPITDKNKQADSYTEVAVSKPYLASNREYYIQLVLPELVMCKKIRHTYFCEELFLVKHKTKHSCESAIFYNLTRNTIIQNCEFKYFYNISVLPSVMDGGSHVLLANMLNEKRLICSYSQGLAHPLPTASYALVSRDILCHCHLQIGLTYVLKSVASCNLTHTPTLEYTVNLAFMNYFHSAWDNISLTTVPLHNTITETVLPISLQDFEKDPEFQSYGLNSSAIPQTLKELAQIKNQKKLFLENRKKLFSEGKAGNGKSPSLPEVPISQKQKSSFLFTAIVHIYLFVGSTLGILWALPYIWYAVKQRKTASLVAAMTLYKGNSAEANPVGHGAAALAASAQSLTSMDLPYNKAEKMICQDPWVTMIVTILTVVGVLVYMYRSCRHLTLVKGHKFASICHIHLVLGNETRYVPIKIGNSVGSPFLFTYNELPPLNQITLQKECLWDHLHFSWKQNKVFHKEKQVPLRQHITVPLCDKIRLRNIMKGDYQVMYMAKQGDTWYNMVQRQN